LRTVVMSLALFIVISHPHRVSAAITATVLNQAGDGADVSSYTASIQPSANGLILAWITNNDADIPSLSTPGITWVMVDTISWESNPYRTTLFRAMPTSVGSNPVDVTMNFSGVKQGGCSWSIIQFKGVATWGTNGDAAVVQYKSEASITDLPIGSNFSVILGAITSGNATAGGFAFSTVGSSVPSPGAGYNGFGVATHGAPATTILGEWKSAGASTVNVTQGSVSKIAGIAVEIGSASTTTLGSGTDPGNVSLAPGGAATMADSFTFQTVLGTNIVTDVTVTLSGTYGIGLVEVTNDSGSTVYGSVSNPSGTQKITLTTPISIGTTTSSYKVRITPKTHVNMPLPPGATYSVTAYVSDWTDTNNHAGSDSGGTTITIDNLSPSNVTAANTTPGDTQATITWTNPADADLGSVVVLRTAGSPVADRPVEGQAYSVGNTVGSSIVACVVAVPGASCTDTGLTNTVTYYYQIFTRDMSGNYAADSVWPPPGPATPNHYQPDTMIKLSSDGAGAYLADNSYEATPIVQVLSRGVVSGSAATYNVRFQNDGTAADSFVITGTGSGSNFTVHYLDDASTDRTAAVTGSGYTTASLSVGASKDWTLTVTPNGGATPVPGGTSYPVQVTATSVANNIKLDRVQAITTSTSANLTLLKSADKGSYKPGEEITYTTVASNGASLTPASAVTITEPIPPDTGFKVGGATFNAGSSTLNATLDYSNGSWGYTPQSGGCSAPAGYDYCVTQVKWVMSGSMPASSSCTILLIVKVK